MLLRVQHLAGNRAAEAVARSPERDDEEDRAQPDAAGSEDLGGAGAPAAATEPPPPEEPPSGGDTAGPEPPARPSRGGDGAATRPRVVTRRISPAPRSSEDGEEPASGPASAAPAAAFSAPRLRVPPPATPGQQVLQSTLLPEAEVHQEAFTTNLNAGLAAVQAGVRAETRALEETGRQQRRQVARGFRRAGGSIEAAITAALDAVNDAALDAESEIESWHEHARGDGSLQDGGRAGQVVRDTQQRTRDLGDDKGDDAVRLADRKAGDARDRIQGYSREATRRGRRYIGNPGGGSGKARTARRKAAREVTRDSASKITENLTDTMRQIRGIGPEVRPEFSRRARELADRLADQLPGIVAEVDDVRNRTVADIARTAAENTTALQNLRTTVLGDLGALETSVKRSLRRATRASREALEGAERTAVEAARDQHDAVAQSAADLIATIVANARDPRIRGRAAQELATRLGSGLGGAFGTAQSRAQASLAQVMTTFATAAEQARATLEQAGDRAASQAMPIAERANRAAQEQSSRLISQLSELLATALAEGDAVLDRAQASMDRRYDEFVSGFDAALRDLEAELDGKVREAAANAREPLDTFDSRIREAMDAAQDEVEASWLERQLSAINWGFLAGLLVGILVTIAVIALLGTGIGALVLAGALAGALSVAASTLTEDLIAGRPTDWGQLGADMAVGAIFGAAGGALSGGAGAVLARQTATSMARQTAVQTGVDFGSSVGLGVVQNLTGGQPWDAGLLLNIATSGAMTSRIPAGRNRTLNNPVGGAVEGLTNRARARAVDRGVARNVTAQERAQSMARFEAAAEAEGAAVGTPAGGAAATSGDGEASATGGGEATATAGGDGGDAPRGEAAGDAGGQAGGPAEVVGQPVVAEQAAAPPPRRDRGAGAGGETPRQRAERAADTRARAERRTLEAQQRREARTNEAYRSRQRHADQVEARLLERAEQRLAETGDEAAFQQQVREVDRRVAAAREANDTWLRQRMQEIDDWAQRQHVASDERFRQQVAGEETSWPQAGVGAGERLDLSWTERGAPRYETGRGATGERGPFGDMSDADLGRAVDTALDDAVAERPISGPTRQEWGPTRMAPRGGQGELFPNRAAMDPALHPPDAGPWRDPLSPPGPSAFGHPGADAQQGYHGAMGRTRPRTGPDGQPVREPVAGEGGQLPLVDQEGRPVGSTVLDYQPAEISFLTPDHPTYAVRVGAEGETGHYVDHLFNTRGEAIAYAEQLARLGPDGIREHAALPREWPGGAQGNPVREVRVDEIPPNTMATRSGIAPQPESAGQSRHVYSGGGAQVQLPYGTHGGRRPEAVHTVAVRGREPAGTGGSGQLELPFPPPTDGQLELSFPEPPTPHGGAPSGPPTGRPPSPAPPGDGGGAGLRRPLPGPEGLWTPAGPAEWPATIPTVHIQEDDREGTMADVVLPRASTSDGAGTNAAADPAARPAVPPSPGVDLDVDDHVAADEEPPMPVQRDADAAVVGERAPARPPGWEALDAWRKRVREIRARHPGGRGRGR